jgi:predicted nucleic acid-binding protein
VAALYFDASALVKLVQVEAGSAALLAYIAGHPTESQRQALTVLDQTEQVALTRAVLDQAGALLPGLRLRTLDAIHLACALALGSELQALVTYDIRLSQAAADLGLVPIAPA